MIDLTKRFLFGCWAQARGNLPRWKARGVEVAFLGVTPEPKNIDFAAYGQACLDNGMVMFKYPNLKHPDNDPGLPGFVGWALGDEPENLNHLLGYVRPNPGQHVKQLKLDAAGTVAAQARLVQMLRRTDPSKVIYQNFNGWAVASMGRWPRDNAVDHPVIAQDYFNWLDQLDWASCDLYPLAQRANPGQIWVMGKAQDRLRSWGLKLKRRGGYVECGLWHEGQNASRMATPAELRGEFWINIARGATMLIYFQQPNLAEGAPEPMPRALEDEIVVNVAALRKYEAHIMGGRRTVITPLGELAFSAYHEVTWYLPSTNSTLRLRLNAQAAPAFGLNPWGVELQIESTFPSPLPPPVVIAQLSTEQRLLALEQWRTDAELRLARVEAQTGAIG